MTPSNPDQTVWLTQEAFDRLTEELNVLSGEEERKFLRGSR